MIPGSLHLGYWRRHKGDPGSWAVRIYGGVKNVAKGKNPYRLEKLAGADDYQDADGEQVLSYAQAQALAHERAARPASRGRVTVDDAMAVYVAYLRAEKKTGDEVEGVRARHISPTLGSSRVAELTTDELTRWRDALAASPASVRTRRGDPQRHKSDNNKRARQATANRILTMLKAALNRAFKRGLVDDDLAWRRVKPFADVDAARPGFLTVAEAKRLINAADKASGFRDLVHAALLTGCRYGELRNLTVGNYHRGKLAILKAKSGDRHVVLTDEGAAFFAQFAAGRPKEAPLLPRADGTAWRPSQQARLMLEACQHAKINPAVGFHQLRHTWASLSVMGGMPLMVVARNLGHRNTLMVERHYGHLTESYIDEAIRASAPKFGKVKRGNVTGLRG